MKSARFTFWSYYLCYRLYFRTVKWLQEVKIRMTADACLAFLWKGDPPGVDYDPNNMVDGFLEGFTLEHVGIKLSILR
jgi:hypothetical protein